MDKIIERKTINGKKVWRVVGDENWQVQNG